MSRDHPLPVKDPFQILADELTLIRHDVEKLQRTSLGKDEAKALNKQLTDGVAQMASAGPRVQAAIEQRLERVAKDVRVEAARAAESAARAAIRDSHAESLAAARDLSQAAGEARRQAWRYFGGFWVWLVAMLSLGALLGALAASATETARSLLSVEQLVRYGCGWSSVGGQIIEQEDGSSFCAFWIVTPDQAR